VLNDFPVREEYPRVFELRFLDLIGYRPRVTECVLCNEALSSTDGAWFSFRHGGTVCKKCNNNALGAIAVSAETRQAMELVLGMDLAAVQELRFPQEVIAEGREIIPRFIQHQLGKALKSLRVMEAVQGV